MLNANYKIVSKTPKCEARIDLLVDEDEGGRVDNQVLSRQGSSLFPRSEKSDSNHLFYPK